MSETTDYPRCTKCGAIWHSDVADCALTGVEMIAAERARQMEREGWTPAHDDEHDAGELARAAEAYLFRYDDGADSTLPGMWPAGWHHRWWKPSADPIRNLVKAGALIAAEIDRLQRAATPTSGGTP